MVNHDYPFGHTLGEQDELYKDYKSKYSNPFPSRERVPVLDIRCNALPKCVASNKLYSQGRFAGWGIKLTAIEISVETILCDQLRMLAALNDLALIENEYLIGVSNSG